MVWPVCILHMCMHVFSVEKAVSIDFCTCEVSRPWLGIPSALTMTRASGSFVLWIVAVASRVATL